MVWPCKSFQLRWKSQSSPSQRRQTRKANNQSQRLKLKIGFLLLCSANLSARKPCVSGLQMWEDATHLKPDVENIQMSKIARHSWQVFSLNFKLAAILFNWEDHRSESNISEIWDLWSCLADNPHPKNIWQLFFFCFYYLVLVSMISFDSYTDVATRPQDFTLGEIFTGFSHLHSFWRGNQVSV